MADLDPMASDPTIEADFAKLLADKAPEVAATARAVRAAVKAALPDAVEQIDFGNGLLALGRSRAMRDLLFAIIPHKAHVNLQLADGADLPNPDGSIEGTGKRIRHVKVRSVEAASSAAVHAAIDAQLAHVRR
jgi:Domain of unknown function (DU1801)